MARRVKCMCCGVEDDESKMFETFYGKRGYRCLACYKQGGKEVGARAQTRSVAIARWKQNNKR